MFNDTTKSPFSAEVYIDASFHQQEIGTVFKGTWILAGFFRDLKEDKQYIDYELLSGVLSEEIKIKININEFVNNKYIPNYRVIYPSELIQVYGTNGFID